MPHKRLFKKYFFLSFLFIIGVAIGVISLLYLDTTFRIKKVEVFGVSIDETKTITTLYQSKSIFLLQQKDIKNILSVRFPAMSIHSYSIQYPNTLVLHIEKEKPEAYLQTDYGYLALSKTGLVVMKERGEIVPSPSIVFYQTISHYEYQMGQQIGYDAIKRALTFIALLDEEGYGTETVAIDSVDMIACKTKGFEIAFSQTRPVDLQTHETKQIIRQIKAGALRIERLDLRFEKPIVQLLKK